MTTTLLLPAPASQDVFYELALKHILWANKGIVVTKHYGYCRAWDPASFMNSLTDKYTGHTHATITRLTPEEYRQAIQNH